MKKGGPVADAMGAMVLYAASNVILEEKLASYHTLALLVVWDALMLALSLIGLGWLKFTGQPVAIPAGAALGLTAGVGIMYFAADFLFIGAYTGGGKLMTVTAITVMFPAMAVAMKYFWTGHGLPNGYQLGSYAAAAVAVFLAVKGSVVR